jgi:hypothetical protein
LAITIALDLEILDKLEKVEVRSACSSDRTDMTPEIARTSTTMATSSSDVLVLNRKEVSLDVLAAAVATDAGARWVGMNL